jgi:Na+/melibiose symporter-like transporter
MQVESQKLSIVEKIGYSLGDSAANFIFQTVMMFLLFFYTDVMGISPFVAGIIFLITRIWDAVNDPMMGAIADRTNTRWGKFRPWVLWSALPFGIIGVLMFTTPNLSAVGKIVYALITYNCMMMIYTVNNVPYCSLTGVLTGDNVERTSLASYRFIFAMLASFAVQGLALPLVNTLGLDNKSVVQFSVQADELTINPKSPGLAKVIVAANDRQGHVTNKEFFVKVTKPIPEMPVLKTAVSNLTLEKGFGQYDIDLTPVFNVGAYGPLTYRVNVENEGIAKAQIVDNHLKITEAGIGVTNVIVIASDKLRSSVNSQFSLAVLAPGNVPPKVVSEPKIILDKSFGKYQINLGDIFSDDNRDRLVYTVKGDNGTIVNTNIADGKLVLTERLTGQDRLTVTANDQKGGLCSVLIPVIVKTGGNMAPAMINPIPSKTVSFESGPIQVRLSDYFTDPDNDNIFYLASVVNQAKGYQRTMVVFCSLAVVFFVITFYTTKERVKPDPAQKTSLKQDIADLSHNGPWLALFFMTIFIFINLSVRQSAKLYYFTYYVKRADLFSLFNMLSMGVTILGIFLSKPLAVRFGKRNTFLVCLFLTAVSIAAFIFLPSSAIIPIFIFEMLQSFCYGPTIPMLWAMMADCADYSEWKTGRRATGMTFSASTFGLKMGLSAGGAIGGYLLSFYGYVAGAEQTATALGGIRLMMSIFPAIPFFLGVALLFFYKIDRKTELQMEGELIERRKQYKYE